METTVPVSPRARRVALPPSEEPAPVTLPADPDVLSMPTTEEIALCAYGLFEARGREHGHDVEDWLEAERLLLAERAAPLTGVPATES